MMTWTALALLVCALMLLPTVLHAALFGPKGGSVAGKQVGKAVSPTRAAQFPQVENQLPLKARRQQICRHSAFEETEVGDGNDNNKTRKPTINTTYHE